MGFSFGWSRATSGEMLWELSHQGDPRALALADRHYCRKKPGSKQFVGPGRQVVLVTPKGDALWSTVWPQAELVQHDWPGAWVCNYFRNEGDYVASNLNRQAVAVTRFVFGEMPRVESAAGPICFISFIDRTKVKPIKVRGVETWGYSYLKAGWVVVGETRKRKLLAFGLPVESAPPPLPYLGYTRFKRKTGI